MPGEDSTKAIRAVFVIDPAGVTCGDWFFCTKELTTEQIDAAIPAHESVHRWRWSVSAAARSITARTFAAPPARQVGARGSVARRIAPGP